MIETENRLDAPLWCSCQLPFFLVYSGCILYEPYIYTNSQVGSTKYVYSRSNDNIPAKVKVVEGGKLSAKPVLNCPLPSWGAEPKLQAVLQLKQGGAHQVTQTQTKIPPTRPVRSQKAKLHLRLSDKRGSTYKMWRWCFSLSQLNVVQTGDQLLQVVVVTS